LKRLFAIKDTASGKIMSEPMFENKQLAKEFRREINGRTKEKDGEERKEIFNYVVTYGPDHDKFDVETAKLKPVKQPEVVHEEVAEAA
jgi:hypothetical protein